MVAPGSSRNPRRSVVATALVVVSAGLAKSLMAQPVQRPETPDAKPSTTAAALGSAAPAASYLPTSSAPPAGPDGLPHVAATSPATAPWNSVAPAPAVPPAGSTTVRAAASPSAPQPNAPSTATSWLADAKPGPYAGLGLGVGGPFGGNTAYGASSSLSESFGALGFAGYAPLSFLGVQAFVHWNSVRESVESDSPFVPSTNTGHVVLYGAELKGMLTNARLRGWFSAGLSWGTGTLHVSDPGSTYSNKDYTVDFRTMPVLGFGIDARVTRELGVGPFVRWYLTGVSKACSTGSGFVVQPAQAPSSHGDQTNCAQDPSKPVSPDILFLGVGLTYLP